jgi:hypothetical protein
MTLWWRLHIITKCSFVCVCGLSFFFLYFFSCSLSGDAVVIDTSGLDDILNKLNEVVTGKLAKVDEAKCGSVNPVKTATENVKIQCAKASKAFEDSPLVEKLKQEGRNVIGLVKTAIVGFIDATNCYFVKVIWDEVTDVMCISLKDAIQWWGKLLLVSLLSVGFERAFLPRFLVVLSRVVPTDGCD